MPRGSDEVLRFSAMDLIKQVNPADAVLARFVQKKQDETDIQVETMKGLADSFKDLLRMVTEALTHDIQQINERFDDMQVENTLLRKELSELRNQTREQFQTIKNTRTYVRVEPLATIPVESVQTTQTEVDKLPQDTGTKSPRYSSRTKFTNEQISTIIGYLEDSVPGVVMKNDVIKQIVADPILIGIEGVEKKVRNYILNHNLWRQFGFNSSHEARGGRRTPKMAVPVTVNVTPEEIESEPHVEFETSSQTVVETPKAEISQKDQTLQISRPSTKSKRVYTKWGDTYEEIKQNVFARLKEMEDEKIPIGFTTVKRRYPAVVNDHIGRRHIFNSFVDMVNQYNVWKLNNA